MKFEQEYKSYPLQEVKAVAEGSGSVEGFGNTSFLVDRYGDIVVEYTGIDELIKNGFIADSHGLDDGSGEMGNYSYKGSKGVVDDAKITDDGLFVKWSFDPSPSTQELRQKVGFRIDKGKSVYMSIGYQAAEQPVYVNAVDFARILPQYIPANKLDRVLQETKGFTRVRLLKAAVNEISLALRPVNTGSIATAFKSESKPTKTMKIEFSANEFKGTFLGENIVDSITVAAIERAWYRLSSVISNTLMPWNYDGGEMTDTDDAAEQITIEGAIDEFAALAKGIYNAMKPLDQATAMGTADDSMKALVARIDEFKLRIAGKEKSEELVSGFKSAREAFDAIEKTINPGPTEDEMKVIGDAELDALENELMLEELY